MPFADFDAARRVHAEERGEIEPVQFKLCGEIFTALQEPMFGDVLTLWDAPELSDNEAAATLALNKFIRGMIDPSDRARYDMALMGLPVSQAGLTLLNIGAYIAQHMTGFPTMPPGLSVPTQPLSGADSKLSSGGSTTSSEPPRTRASRSRTGSSPATPTTNRNGASTASSSSSRRKK